MAILAAQSFVEGHIVDTVHSLVRVALTPLLSELSREFEKALCSTLLSKKKKEYVLLFR